VGAILTQNTNWTNVAAAINNLRRHHLLSAQKLRAVGVTALASFIRPCGYYNVKAHRVKNFVEFLWKKHRGSMARMARTECAQLRQQLLSVDGVGPETADSILLYACDKPTFVVDAYTRRILSRHGLVGQQTDYDEIKQLYESHLPRDVRLFNEYHALLVQCGKTFCRPKKQRCDECPLRGW